MKSTAAELMIVEVSLCFKNMHCNTCSGKPASWNALTKCSPHNGVCAEGFKMTELPAIKAGTIEFTAVSNG